MCSLYFFQKSPWAVNEIYSSEESHALRLIKVSALNHGLGLLISGPAQSSENVVQHFSILVCDTPFCVWYTILCVWYTIFMCGFFNVCIVW